MALFVTKVLIKSVININLFAFLSFLTSPSKENLLQMLMITENFIKIHYKNIFGRYCFTLSQ